ncbi:MAG TPA: hypothetical protein VGS04_06755 [Nitrososphaerales archaeon]|nr:hypothetical protein [Nitrososphaerales archaeon]
MAKRAVSVIVTIVAVVMVASVLLFETNGYVYIESAMTGASHKHTFTISLSYSGPWKLSYHGYTVPSGIPSLPKPLGANTTVTGTGAFSRSITLSGPDNASVGVCATAQKLDGSNARLILSVTGGNETSLPYGSVSTCGSVRP